MRVRGRRFGVGDRAEAPLQHAGGGVERKDAQLWRRRVQNPVRNDRLALHLRVLERVAGVVGPGDLQRGDVGRRDLRQRRVTRLLGTAAILWPVSGNRENEGKEPQNRRHTHGHVSTSFWETDDSCLLYLICALRHPVKDGDHGTHRYPKIVLDLWVANMRWQKYGRQS